MTTDLFHPLPGSRMHRRHVHNVRVLDVRAADEGYELLTVETVSYTHLVVYKRQDPRPRGSVVLG